MEKKQNPVLISFLTLVLVVGCIYAGFYLKGRFNINTGSVSVSNEYYATSTPQGGPGWNTQKIKVGAGTFGSFVITKAGDSEIWFLDATNTPLKIDNFATTTSLLAHFPASAAAGTYTFDVNFSKGLVIYVPTGNTGTSTITWI